MNRRLSTELLEIRAAFDLLWFFLRWANNTCTNAACTAMIPTTTSNYQQLNQSKSQPSKTIQPFSQEIQDDCNVVTMQSLRRIAQHRPNLLCS